MLGYGEGGPIVLTAAAREDRIRGIGLLAAPGRPGREFALEQQTLALERMKQPAADREAKIALQTRVLDAVISGKGWEALSAELRYQADTPWFKSWLLFDPARVIERLEQPMLILHGALDQETPVTHADRLDALGRSRRKIGDTHTRKIVVPGVNHLLVRADTGQVDEYATLSDRALAADVTTAIVSWLNATLPARR